MTDPDPLAGLTLEPPSDDDGERATVGFAPELDDTLPLPDVPASTTPRARPRAAAKHYPRVMAALAALRGDAPGSPAPTSTPRPRTPGQPAITAAPPPLARPRPSPEPRTTTTTPGAESLMDMLLVGTSADGGREAHFQFADDVLSGMYLHLERHADGLFMRFLVGDEHDRRTMGAYVDELVARFTRKGTAVKGYEIVVRADDD